MARAYQGIGLSLIFLFCAPSYSLDKYNVIESLLPAEKLPRILNSDDIPQLHPGDPQPLFSPEGDFNGDGLLDVAVSGTYGLPKGPRRFFLLVAEKKSESSFEKLFFEEYQMPIFIHRRGTTGEADPEDEAFSISYCVSCNRGEDFYWDPKERKFTKIAWKPKFERLTKIVDEPARQAPPKDVEAALKMIGLIPDVVEFTKKSNKENRHFGVRLEPLKGKKKRLYNVRIFEKDGKKEKVYDIITVDLRRKKVLHRKTPPRMPKKKPENPE